MEKTADTLTCDKLCRLCLSTRGETLPIFSSGSSSDESDPPLLASKIHACVSVEITEDDALPTQICKKCVSNVNNWHIFKRICDESQVKLQSWVNDGAEISQLGLRIKKEPSPEDADDDIVIDASYPGVELVERSSEMRLQPEGPPILASLGLAPRNEKDDSEIAEQEEYHQAESLAPAAVNSSASKSGSRRPVAVAQLASKNCLVCNREYRYSHNARRHELNAHRYDRYTNKVKSPNPAGKFRPNPFNSKSRLLPNSVHRKMQLMPKNIGRLSSKTGPFPVRIRSLVDMQPDLNREPEILKSLLTSRPEMLVSEPEIMRSGSESPETLISEPEFPFQVEAIISEPDAFVENVATSDEENDYNETNTEEVDPEEGEFEENGLNDGERVPSRSGAEADSDCDVEMSSNLDINKIIGIDVQESDKEDMPERKEHIVSDGDHVTGDDLISTEETLEENGEVTRNEVDEEYTEDVTPPNDDGEQESNDEDDDDDVPPIISPLVVINEDLLPTDCDNQNIDGSLEEEEEEEEAEEKSLKQEIIKPVILTVTPSQKVFISKYRDIIGQINTMKCHCCDRTYPRRKSVIQHLQKSGQRVPKHTCYNCVFTFGHIGALLSHMRANCCTGAWKLIYQDSIPDSMVSEAAARPEPSPQREELLNKSQYKDVLNARSYACRLCPAKFQLKQFIMRHILDVHENGGQRIPLLCSHCKYRFKENRLWKKHIRNGECTVNIACDLCDERFRGLQDFTDHALSVHAEGFIDQSENVSRSVDGRPTDCHICHKNTSSYHNLVKHLKTIHDEERPHMCQHCDSKFEMVGQLDNHIYQEHSDKIPNGLDKVDLNLVKEEVTSYNYSCTDCSSMFDTVDGWTEHQVAAHGHIAYECDQCDKKFLQDSDLADHKNTHLRVKFYSCTLCSNSYSSAQKLSEHMTENHQGAGLSERSGDSPFFCEICLRSFKSRQAFSNHMRIHAKVPTTNRKSGEMKRPIPERISQPIRNVTSHINYRKTSKTISDAPYACDICGKGFLHKKNIWKHKKILHPEVVKRSAELAMVNRFLHAGSTEEDEDPAIEEQSGGLSIPQFDSFTSAGMDLEENGSESGALYQCDLCDKKFAVKSSIWKHKRVKHGIINPNVQDEPIKISDSSRTSCTICKINFADKKAYYRHRKHVHKSSAQVCTICRKVLNSTEELCEHLGTAHAKELLVFNAGQTDSSLNEQEPSAIHSSEEEEEDGASDSARPEDRYQARYPCETCGKCFLGMMALQNHSCAPVTGGSETYDCEICSKSYTSISALKSHRGWHLRSPDGKAAFSNSGLWMPQNKVTNKVSRHEVMEAFGNITHSTPIPDPQPLQIKRKLPPDVQLTLLKRRKLPDELTVELVTTTPRPQAASLPQSGLSRLEDRFCRPCGKEFTKKAAYLRHVDEVHRLTSVSCPICSKSFTRKSTLLVHMRKHESSAEAGGAAEDSEEEEAPAEDDPRLFACDLCDVRYHSAKSLRRHCAKHHNIAEEDVVIERPAPPVARVAEAPPAERKCSQCGEEFKTEADAWQHRHYPCKQCGLYFSKPQYLVAHTRARHSDSDKMFFPCSMCDRFYMNKKSLQRHVEAAH